MFQPVEGNVNFPQQELAVGRFWKERQIYEKSLERRAGAPPFVFYEGPPTANGMPHPGHCLTRAIKDLFPRYKTMRGYRCERKAGWDTHGLPVEVEVCKELGIHTKEEIEEYGIERFIQKCQASVWRYMQEWEQLTERIGFWVDLKNAYVTYHQSYVESVWWSLKNLFDRGLLYQGHKIVWWWAQGGTALSAGEVGQGYRQVADPSVYVKFPLLDENGNVTDVSYLVWTTTPWTLPSNQFVAINPSIEYVGIIDRSTGERFVVAGALVESLGAKTKRNFEAYSVELGRELVGSRYLAPFDSYYSRPEHRYFGKAVEGPLERSQQKAWKTVAASFVTTESGTGIVHIAPAFGEDDYDVLAEVRAKYDDSLRAPQLINCVAPDGKFTDEGPDYCRGRWVKDCDKDIIRDLKQRGLLFHQEQYIHDYPFCWRAEEDPLIQYPRESWFIRTTEYKDEMLANNAQIKWLPEHIKDGRFGKFLESNVDWALSRERYWGTPLPIWKCEKTGRMEAVGSYDELMAKPGVTGGQVWAAAKAKNPELPDDLRVHKPYIDAAEYDSPFAKGARMRRVPEVIDCWYDSGAMPFAQWGYRGEAPLPGPPRRGEGVRGVEANRRGEGTEFSAAEKFHEQFPADFISEAIDQTRGWFYSQLAISTLMFGGLGAEDSGLGKKSKSPASSPEPPAPHPYPHPFRNCIVLGLMLGEDGQKMSKSKRNYLPPNEIFDKYGADALRWYFFANQPPWTSIRYSEQAIKDSIPEFLLRLWNVYSFFVIYANIDDFDPAGEPASAGGSSSPNPHAFAAAKSYRPVKDRSELDRWILSELHRTIDAVTTRMDAYDNFGACQSITEFVDALSNWYVRRSRDRFWAADKRAVEKLDAYWTLYECLVTTTKLVAPFVPFVAETLWQNLAREGLGPGGSGLATPLDKQPPVPSPQPLESVHLCDYPVADSAAVDEALSAQMNLVREITSLGRNARNAANLKVRQPLAKVEVVLADTTHQKWLEEHVELIADELNVKAVEFTTRGEQYISYSVVPNFKRLGPRLGKNMPAAKKLLGEIDAAKMLSELKSAGKVSLNLPDGSTLELDNEDIEVRLTAKEGWAAAQGKGCVVVLATALDQTLLFEGMVNDVVRFVQDKRKELACDYLDWIALYLVIDSSETNEAATDVIAAFRENKARFAEDTRAVTYDVFDVNSPEGAAHLANAAVKGYNPIGLTLRGHQIDVDLDVIKCK